MQLLQLQRVTMNNQTNNNEEANTNKIVEDDNTKNNRNTKNDNLPELEAKRLKAAAEEDEFMKKNLRDRMIADTLRGKRTGS